MTHAQLNAFTEAGAGVADLAVSSSDMNSVASVLGVRAAMPFALGGTTVVPELRAAWRHELADAAPSVAAAFAISPGTRAFTVTGSNFGRDSALVGLGIADKISPNVKLELDYDGSFAGGYRAHAVTAGFKLSF